MHRQNYRAVLAALALVHGHRIRGFELAQHIKAVARLALVVKYDCDALLLEIDLPDAPDVAVENARARAETVRPFPQYIIIVADLHYPIALAVTKIAVLLLTLARHGRIEHRLKRAIEFFRSRFVLARGREHLNVRRLDAHIFRQPRRAQLADRLHHRLAASAPQEEKVPVGRVEHRQLAVVDGVRVHDDEASLRLPENFRQPHSHHDAAADEVGEQIPRAHRRKLVGVTHQQQPRVPRQRPQQRRHEL